MPHNKRHIGSANQDATTYGMPKRETESRLKQHTSLYNKAKKKSEAADKTFYANPTVKGLYKAYKSNKKTAAIAASAMKLVEHKKKFGSGKGYN
tara:strand:- start:1476 stop:1757 length:282 start_codon:yes stop_codon:yes gene_type:complete